jgi:hypothetical protein
LRFKLPLPKLRPFFVLLCARFCACRMSASPKAPDAEDAVLRFYIHGGLDPLGRTHAEMMAYSLDRMEECHDYVQWLWPLHEPSAFAEVYPVLTEEQALRLSASEEARIRMLAALARFRLFFGLPGAAPLAAAAPSPSSEAAVEAAGPKSQGGGGGGSGGSDPGAGTGAGSGSGGSASSAGGREGGPGSGGAASGAGSAGGGGGAGSGLPAGFAGERAALWAHNGDHNLLRVTRIIRSLRFFGLEEESRAFYKDVCTVARWAKLPNRTLAFWKKASEEDVWKSLRG